MVTGFTITNPGVGYTAGDVLTPVLFGGGATTAATVGAITLTANASGGLTKNSAGNLTLSGASSFTGNVLVNAGTLTGAFTNIANPVTSAFGNATIAGRTITVASGATLALTANDSFGNQTAVAANLPSLIINGTMSTTRYNQIGAITLNAATLSSANTIDSGNFQNFQFLGSVTVGGSAPSFISATGAANFNGNHLFTNTTFNVADVTANSNTDLTVSVPLLNQSGNYASAAGGFTKTGAGTMNLSATSTYTGATAVTNGTLRLTGSGGINASSGITVNGAGAKFVQNSSVAVTPVVTLTSGTVDGTGTIGTVNAAAGTVIANGDGGAGVLTITTLTHGSPATYNLTTTSTSPVLVVGTLTTNGGIITINASNTSWTNGLEYDLVGYTTLNGVLTDFTKGTIANLGARQSATLTNPAGFIALNIAGDLPVWTGIVSGAWTTNVIPPNGGGNKNWKLQTGGAATDFITGDTVLFDNTATGTRTVDISTASVSPISTTVSNSGAPYTIMSSGGFGIASGFLTKDGTATLTLATANTYTGPTSLNDGTTNLTGSLGNTAVTVAGPATLSLQSAGAISQNTVTVNGTITQTVDNALSGTAALVLNNGATLGNANTHNGGTTLNAGTFNINHATAVGAGTLTLNGGTLDNTNGGVTLTNNNAQRWGNAASVAFTGTNAVNLGTGAVTLGTDATAGSFTLTNNSALAGTSLTIGGAVAGGTGGAAGVKTLNIGGAGNTAFTGNFSAGGSSGIVINDTASGTLTLSGAASGIVTLNVNGGAGSIVDLGAGNLTVANGGGSIVQSTTGGTINGSGSIVIGSALGDFGTAGGTTLTVNAKIAGTNAVDFFNANGGAGFGTIVLAAANTSTGGVNVQNTRVVIPAGGAINALNTANSGVVSVGGVAALSAQLDLNGGTINANSTAAPGFSAGTANGAAGTINMTGGAINVNSEMWLSNGAGGVATMTMSAGSVNTGSWFVVGRNLGTGTLNLNGGTITKGGAATNYLIVGSLGATGTINQTAGALNATAGGIRLGENNGATPALNALWDMTGGTSTVNGEINVAWRSSQATWNVSGASTTVSATGRLIVGAETNNNTINTGPIVAGAPVGLVNISGGSVTFAGGDSRIGGDNSAVSVNATGTVNVSGTGVLNFGGNVQIGAYGKGFMNISGTGAVNSTAGFPSVGRYVGGVGELNVNGGTFTQTNAANLLVIGEEGTGTLNLNSGAVTLTGGLRVGHTATGNGTINLNGGTLSTPNVLKTVAGSTATWKFNGGTLKTTADSADFLQGIPAASISVANGGAIVDTDSHLVTITQGLAPAPSSTGGLTKQGAGTLTLTGSSTFTGSTVVNNGTLELAGANTLSATGNVTVNTGGTLLLSNTGTTDRINNAATMTLAGGTVAISGNVVEGSSPGIGALTLTASSVIDFANGDGTLKWDDSHSAIWSGTTLSIFNWTDGSDHLFFSTVDHSFNGSDGGLTDSQLLQVSFFSGSNTGFLGTAGFLSGGLGEIVPVPEPSSVATVMGLLGLIGWRERRKTRAARAAVRRAIA